LESGLMIYTKGEVVSSSILQNSNVQNDPDKKINVRQS